MDEGKDQIGFHIKGLLFKISKEWPALGETVKNTEG